MRRIAMSAAMAAVLAVSGCGTIMNPYASTQKCPLAVDGKCQPIRKSYQDSLRSGGSLEAVASSVPAVEGTVVGEEVKDLHSKTTPYRHERAPVFSALAGPDPAGEIETPVRDPGEVHRVLIFDYVDNDVLYTERHIFVEVRKPRWLVGTEVKR